MYIVIGYTSGFKQFLFSPPIWGNDPIWRSAYFSDGLVKNHQPLDFPGFFQTYSPMSKAPKKTNGCHVWKNEQWPKPWLLAVYRGLYYPVIWGLFHKPWNKDPVINQAGWLNGSCHSRVWVLSTIRSAGYHQRCEFSYCTWYTLCIGG